MKLIVDTASILGRFMHTTDPEFGIDMVHDGKKFHIPSFETCMERVEVTFEKTLREQSLRWTDVILVLEQSGTGAARKKICPTYKANRESRPKEFYNVFNQLVTEFSEFAMRKGAVTAVSTQIPQVEGDDLAAEICKRFPETILFTGDKDLLAAEATHHLLWDELDPVRYPAPRELIVLYRCLVTGDTSDGIKSCKGFGEKAWLELKQLIGWEGLHELDKMFQEKRLHELAEDVPHMKKLQLLIDQAEDLYMSYKLMQPMHVPAHKVRWSARVTDCSKVLVTAENFERCKGEVIEELSRCSHVTLDYETSTPPESDAWVEQTDGGIKVDVISSEITGMSLKINDSTYYFSVDHRNTDNIKLKDLESILLLIKDKEVYAQNLLNFENVVTHNTFGFMLENAYDTRIMANYCFENDFQGLKHLSKVHLNYDQQSYETTLAKASEESGFECKKMRDITGDQVLAYAIDDAITTDSIRNLLHCIMLYENTWEVFKQVEQKAGLVTSLAFCKGVDFDWDVYYRLKEENDANTIRAKAELESMLLEVGWGELEFKPFLVLTGKTVKELYQMVMGYELETKARSVGSVVEAIEEIMEGNYPLEIPEADEDNKKLSTVISAVSEGIEAVNALAEKYWVPRAELNTRSPTQVKTLLYDVLNCPVRIRNPATDVMRKKGIWEGSPSTDDTAIANAIAYLDTHKDGIAVLQKLVELKGYLTRESLFLAKYPLFCHWKTGKLHSNMSQSNTTTRRFTHSAANYAQLSKKKGKEMRDMLTVPKDWSIVALDESGQELRVAAWSTREPNFLSCYMGTPEQRRDVHSLVGLQIMLRDSDPKYKTYEDFKNAVDAEDPDAKSCRVTGKLVGFATQYLCRAKKLSQELCCSERDAQEFMEAKAKAFPRLGPAIDEWIELCRKRGYSETFLGARRHLHKQFAMKSEGEQASAGRLAWSFRVQGSSAEMIKLVMGYCWERGLIDEHCHLLTSIHDELVFAVHNSVLEERIPKLHACITAPYADMEIELESTPEVGTHFGSLKKYSLDKDK